MKLGILMDPLKNIKAYKDTTVALIESALKLGWSCAFFTDFDMHIRKDEVFAHIHDIKIKDIHSQNWAEVKDLGKKPLTFFDIILMRKDPPFNMEYIYSTYALELAMRHGVIVANNPQSLRDANEKCFTLNFPQCCPDTLVSMNKSKLSFFWEEYKSVVFKPLHGMGGRSIFYVGEDGQNLSVILDTLTNEEKMQIMAQPYISEIRTTGDKRILMLHGKPVPYALARIPAKGEWRGNLAAGAKGRVVPLSKRDNWICEQVGPLLKNKQLSFVGLDIIGDYLTEINVTSPTCLREIATETKIDIAQEYLLGLS